MDQQVNIQQNARVQLPVKYVRMAKFLQFISSSLATTYAAKMFSTPLRHERPERELAMMKSAQVSMLIVPQIKKRIKVFSYGFSKKKVLLVHGWSGRGTQMFRLADKLLENGYMVISFDAPAHGDSEGKTTLIVEFIASALALQQKFGPFTAAIGHSLGGQAVLNAVNQGLSIEKIVSISSGDSVVYFLNEIITKLKLRPSIAKKMNQRFSKKYGVQMEEYSGSNAAKKVNIPTLIIHDTDDKEVPVSCAHSIRQNLMIGQLHITKGLGHRRILNDADTINRIIKFITL